MTTPTESPRWPRWFFWVFVCLGFVAVSPVFKWAYEVWFGGLLGGGAAAILAMPIAFVLGVIVIRNHPGSTDEPSTNGPTLALMAVGMGLILALQLALAEKNGLLLVGCLIPALVYIGVWGRFGWSVARPLALPIGFLLFALPWEEFLRGNAEVQLQSWTTDVAMNLLQLAGYDVWYYNEYTLDSQRYYVIVNETCSGVNLTVTLLMYTLVYGWLVQPRLSGRALLLVCVFPLALFANGLRVSTIFLLGHYGGNAWADGFWHTGSAYVIFLPVFWALHLINSSVNRWGASRKSAE
ncbi:MAG: exosortase/archaeosortase family protein [Myxococcota bacterium]|nr:exosortase/archaeosortase family protein [Myxococcota bacterium]